MLTIIEASKVIGISPTALRKAMRKGRIVPVLDERPFQFTEEEVARFKRSRKPRKGFLTVRGAAKTLGMTRWGVYKLVERGRLTPQSETKVFHPMVFKRADVEVLAAERRCTVQHFAIK